MSRAARRGERSDVAVAIQLIADDPPVGQNCAERTAVEIVGKSSLAGERVGNAGKKTGRIVDEGIGARSLCERG